MKKIRILQFPISNSKGGITQYILQNWKFIDRTKFHFDFATMSRELDFLDELKQTGSNVYYISCYAEENEKKFVEEFKKILIEGEYDIIHLHTKQWKSFLIEKIAKEVGVKRIIIHAHSTGIDTLDIQKRKLEIYMHNNTKKYLTENIATDYWACSWKAADFIFGNQIPIQKIKIMKNAIDLSKFKYNEKSRNKCRKKLGINNEFVIGNIGRLVYQKNQEFLLEVFKNICKNDKDKDYILLLVGAGERMYEYKSLSKRMGLEDKVIFTGHRTDVPDLLQAIDIFCLPSRFEGLPIGLIEAQASYLPCIASDSITDEVVINHNVDLLPLDAKLWETKIVEYSHNKYNRNNKNASLEKSGYDIRRQIKYVEKSYFSE